MSKCSILVNEKYKSLAEQNKDVMDEMVKDINDLKESSKTVDGFRKKVDKYIKDTGEEKIINDYYSTIQLTKRNPNMERIKKSPNRAEGLKSLLRASNYNTAESGVSIESIQSTRAIKYQTITDQAFTDSEYALLATRQLDADIIKHIASGGKEGNPQVKKFADTFSKLNNYLHQDKVNVGIQENYIKDYVFNQRDLHNADKLEAMGKDTWVQTVYNRLDHERTFQTIETEADKIKYLENVYDGFIERSYDAEAVDFSNLPKDRVKGQIPKKYTKPRQLYFTPDGLAQMFTEFSDKSLLESIHSESAKTARDVAIFEVLGPNGQNEFATLVQKNIRELQDQHKGLDPNSKEYLKAQKEIDQIKKAGVDFNDYFKEITNSSNVTPDKGWAETGSNIRSLTSMSALGGAAFSAITDIATGISALQVYTGKNYFELVGKTANELISNISPERQKALASRLSIALESGMGNLLRIQGSTGNISKGINKLNYFYTKINPLQQQARLHRAALTSVLSMHLGEVTGGDWKSLDFETASSLMKGGIKEQDWKAMQAIRQPLKDGEFVLDSVSMFRITDEVAKESIAAHKVANPLFGPKTPDQYRAYLEKRIDSYYNEFSNMAAPNPGLRERKTLMMGTQKGTKLGEVIRTISMLKSFTVKQASIMQRIYLANPDRSKTVSHMSGLFLGLTTMGYIAESLRAIAKNETPPDPTSPETIRNSIIRSGAGSLAAEALLGQSYGTKTDFLTGLIAGPVISKADQLIGVSRNIVTGEAGAKDLTTVGSMLPGSNLWYLKSAMHYTFMDDFKEELNPGHKRRMEQRRKDNEGLLWRQQNVIE